MEEAHLAELCLKEATYWWHVNKRQLVLKYLAGQDLSAGRVLEVGCGGGLLSSLLTRTGVNVVASDILVDALLFARAKGVAKCVTFDVSQPWPFNRHSFQIVIMLDVLEHIKNDVACLHEAQRVLRPGGLAVLTVPAHQFLFSSWDKVLGHHRRYSKSRLRRTFRAAGFQPMVISYQNALSFLPALVLRGKDRLLGCQRERAEFPDVPKIVNRCLKWWGHLECALIPGALLMGLSLFAVLRSE